MVSAARGRSTRTFRRMRARTLDTSDICYLCGHPGADSADHIVARDIDPELAEDEDNLAPAHHEPCPTCGARCNREKGTRSVVEATALRTSRDWFSEPVTHGHKGGGAAL